MGLTTNPQPPMAKRGETSRRPRIAFYCPSTGNAMNHMLQSIIPELSAQCELLLIVPSHYKDCQNHEPVIRFRAHRSKVLSAFREVNMLEAFRLWRKIVEWNPDVLHIFNGDGYPWTIALAFLATRSGLPVLLTVHDPEIHPGGVIDRIDSTLRSFTYSLVTATHLFSKQLAHKLPERVRLKPLFFLPHWSTEALFRRFHRSTRARENMILFFGRVAPYKGLNTLVKATVLLGGQFRTVIAGSGSLDAESRAIIAQYPNLFERREYFVSEEEIASLLETASVCALPYVHATQSSIPMIAAAFGVPVVASNIGGFIEDVLSENGCLVPPQDPSAFAEAVLEAVNKKPTPILDRDVGRAACDLREIYLAVSNFSERKARGRC
jgi:glycosyltransferase involved in cell wall biosynthesis